MVVYSRPNRIEEPEMALLPEIVSTL
jgi:hypothetical protein